MLEVEAQFPLSYRVAPNTHGGLQVDIRQPFFGTTASLAKGDFEAAPSQSLVATFDATPVNKWYSATLNNAGLANISKTGTTQFRLGFAQDDNDDNGADTMKFYSGNAGSATRPQLIIEYYVP